MLDGLHENLAVLFRDCRRHRAGYRPSCSILGPLLDLVEEVALVPAHGWRRRLLDLEPMSWSARMVRFSLATIWRKMLHKIGGEAMKTTLLFAVFALVGTAVTPVFACDYTHTTAAQSSTVVACAGGKCEAQQPTTQQGGGSTAAR
jgi:hypothetical protein